MEKPRSNGGSTASKNNGNAIAGKAAASQQKTRGPVQNLEEHVSADWWRKIFNSLYLKTDGDVVDDKNITRREVDMYISLLGMEPSSRVLDLCCGQGRHSLELARRGFANVTGIDRSAYLVRRGRATARKEGLTVKFREGDARKLPFQDDYFDYVIIPGNSFGYFENMDDDRKVLREVMRILKPWGKVLLDVADGDYMKNNYQSRSWEWIDKKMFVCRERTLSADGQRLISREVITRVDKGVVQDQFYAERLYDNDSIKALVSSVGFVGADVNGGVTPDSQRNQDLGMMEMRMMVTGTAKKEWSKAVRSQGRRQCEVAVLLGDPTMADDLKPNSVFDDDDIYTIDRLKDALRSLNGYGFRFISDHSTLIRELTNIRNKVDFVFNLCDEGLRNDPRKELHVPAILEALGIPYTGGGPQCLAFCYDKSLVRGVAKEMDIPVPRAIIIKSDEGSYNLPFPFPVIVKPNYGDSSFGITVRSVCWNGEDLISAVGEIRKKLGSDKPVLVEEFLTGKDITVGLIGNANENFTVLPITEEDYSELEPGLPHICGYEAKWLPDSPYSVLKSIPAELPDNTKAALEEWCQKLFERLECRDYARMDWRLDAEGVPRLLEVNPNPGWCWDGHLAKMSGFAGISYPDMLAYILEAAKTRMKLVAGENTVAQSSGQESIDVACDG